MERTVKLFVISADSPAGPPRPERAFTVEAATVDGLWERAREKLIAEGYRVRSVSFGPGGLVVYAEEQGE